MRILLSLFLALPLLADTCPSTVPSGVTSCYYVASGGSDAAAGTKAAPWAHLPYMPTWTGSHVPSAGKGYILKGGDTWGTTNFWMDWTASGTESNPIYIGVDSTWYTGGAWARPIFTCGGAVCAGGTGSVGQASMVRAWAEWVVIDNIELTGLYLPQSRTGNLAYIMIAGTGDEVKNTYIHGWSHEAFTTCAPNCKNIDAIVGTTGGYSSMLKTRVHNNVVDGSDTAMDDGATIGFVQYIYGNVMRYVFDGIDGRADYVYDNLVEHVDFSAASGAHCNEMYHKGPIDTDANVIRIFNNVIRDSSAAGCVVMFTNNLVNCPTCVTYVYNNLIYGLTGGSNPVIATGQLDPFGTQYVYNNTIIPQASDVSCIGNGNASPLIGTVVFDNNHCVTTTGSVCASGGSVTCTDGGHNLKQTAAEVATNYYGAAGTYPYSPKSGAAEGVGAGANLTSLVGTIGTAFGLDTTFGPVYNSANQTATGAARSSLTRPNAASDIGAYQQENGAPGSSSAPGATIAGGTLR